MTDLHDLYREVILDHHKNPRNFRRIEDATAHADGHNPLCGDRISVYLRLDGDTIADISFQGTGCAISQACASMMTSSLKGRTREEIAAIKEEFHRMITGRRDEAPALDLDKLEVFSGVSQFPVRVKCASLAWHTLQAALDHEERLVVTE